jgi:hemerythrin-like domain-containing protein
LSRSLRSAILSKRRPLAILKRSIRGETRRLRRVAGRARPESDQDLLRQNVDNIIRDFIDHERQHMAMEERVVFPARPQCAAATGLGRCCSENGRPLRPLLPAGFEEKFNRLRRNILKMEEEAEAERAD